MSRRPNNWREKRESIVLQNFVRPVPGPGPAPATAPHESSAVHPACTNEVLSSPSQADVESVSGAPALTSAVPARYSMNTHCLL